MSYQNGHMTLSPLAANSRAQVCVLGSSLYTHYTYNYVGLSHIPVHSDETDGTACISTTN